MAITKVAYAPYGIVWIVGKDTKLEKRFTREATALAYRDAMNDMKKAGLL